MTYHVADEVHPCDAQLGLMGDGEVSSDSKIDGVCRQALLQHISILFGQLGGAMGRLQ